MLLTNNKCAANKGEEGDKDEKFHHIVAVSEEEVFGEMSTKGLSPLCIRHETLEEKQHILHDMNAWKSTFMPFSRQYDIMKAF